MSGGVLMTPELAKVVQQMVREYLRTSPDTKPQRAFGPARMDDYSIKLGKVDDDCEAGDTVTVSIWKGTTKGSETDTGDNIEAYLRYPELTADSWCHVMYHNGGWEIFVGDPC